MPKTDYMEMLIIKPESAEWNFMWEWLGAHPLNAGLEEPTVAFNPNVAESWQYMGSFRSQGRVIHTFRHRAHPLDDERKYLKVAASEHMCDDDIDIAKPVK